MKITKSSIEFDNVLRAATSINDAKRTVKIDSYSFSNINSKGDFKQINSISDLEALHDIGVKSAKSTFAIMND
ncbi:hypothetical protein [Candidatus Thiodubiliella endoseptemdiera]|uniref:hypothetical protein n=1 Tax=Candidatus Thiodubiliella endoseptemdiera TaxID=2738886 RepID=UPI0034DF5C48